ncbi:MAG: TRAP transporter large permease subunit, partial [Candidatus Rokubacteria bacterium]|nr:TRAP transporter large permease subunit [Candidatus Rokubacteria bacterium]
FGSIAAILAAAGLLVGLVNLTGLGLMLSGALVSLAQGNLLLLLVLTAGTSIILGMGVPTSAAYIILAILVAPALIELGVNPVSAHLFVFYYAVMAVITPPFAPDAFVAAGISGANPMATAVQACKIGLIGMLLPFAMIYSDALIMVGPPLAILAAVAGSVVGILALGAAVAGFLFHPLRGVRRLLCLVAAIALIWPELYSTLAGVLLYLGVCGLQNRQFHRDIANKYIFRYIFRRYALAPSAAGGQGVRDLNV